MMSALRQPGISALKTIQDEKEDPVGWLQTNIQVTAPMESEVLQVRLRGDRPDDVWQIVNAVTKAYLSDVVNKEKAARLLLRDNLDRQYKEKVGELRKAQQEFDNLAKTLGASDSVEVTTQRSLLLDHLGTLRLQVTTRQAELSAIDAELAVIDAREKGEIADADVVSDEVLDAMLARDPLIAELRDRLASIDEAIASQAQRSARGVNDPAVRRLDSQRQGLAEKIRERSTELRPQVAAQLALESSGRRPGAAVESPVVLRKRRELIAAELAKARKEFEETADEVKQLGQANADLKIRGHEIEQLEAVTRQMGIQLETTEADISLPPRVTVYQEASKPEGNDRFMRAMLATLAGLAGLALGVGAVIGFEYLRDRIGTAAEVSQRLGVRVVGTLPRVQRKQSNHADVAQSVDGVRALLAQGRDQPKVILVTSAVEHEGKTTFASQLAASLARSDKRTLLLDGDLRHPNVHLALGLDLRSGLPELLRGEIGNDEAVQPTSVDGLFAVTGGSCDYAAITALSRPELARIMKGFRQSFDHVVIDAGPVLAFADALLLGQQSDVAILATMRDVSRVPLVSAAIDRLRSAGVRVLGTVVNGVQETGSRRRYAALTST
jgi:capsular exopolysaccharide synthesis family protein